MRGASWAHHGFSKMRGTLSVAFLGVVACGLVGAVVVAVPAYAAPAGGPVPAGFEPASVTFVSANDGWVLGTAPCSNPVCTSVVRTTDGGRTWSGIPAPTEKLGPAALTNGQQGLSGLRFANGSDGYAYGDDLWVTHDGGATWAKAVLPGSGSRYVGQLAAYNGYVYVLVVPTASASASAGTLYRSPVSSQSWTSVLSVPSPAPSSIGLDVHGDNVWVTAPGQNQTATEFRSTNDGASWTQSALPCSGDLAVGPSTSYVGLACAVNPAAGSSMKQVYLSTDGGASFTTTSANPPLGGVSLSAAIASTGDVFLASASGASFLYASFDGGNTWQTVLQSDTGGQLWHDLGFTTPLQGVAVEGDPALSTQPSQLWLTRDGGHLWQPIVFANGPAVRMAGASRYGTAAAASQAEFPTGGAGAVVLARGDAYPDALVGAPLAAAKDAPLLLTTGTQLPAVTKAEIQRVLAPGKTVYVLGGTAAVPASIQNQLTALGYTVVRYGGATRYGTAIDVANALGDPSTVLLATGENFPDALSAGPAASTVGAAVLLTAGTTMPTPTRDYLSAHATTTYAVGGPAATADPSAQPLVGADRYQTAIKVARTFFNAPTTIGVATGENFPDALSGGAYLAHQRMPLVLAQATTVPATTTTYLQAVSPSATSAELFGGAAALSAGVQDAISAAIG